MSDEIIGFGAVSVANAVESGQVGRSLRGGDDVISGHGVFGIRQRNLNGFRTEIRQLFDRGFDEFLHFWVQAFGEIFFGQSDFHSLHIPADGGGVIRNVFGETGGVAVAGSGDGLQK